MVSQRGELKMHSTNLGRTAFAIVCAAVILLSTIGSPIKKANAQGVIPYQLIAKVYTEVLGRAPDPAGWKIHSDWFAQVGCSLSTVKLFVTTALKTWPEFQNLGYDNGAKILVLFRVVMQRDPDLAGFNYHLGLLNNGTFTWNQLVDAFIANAEFTNSVFNATSAVNGGKPKPAICNNSAPNTASTYWRTSVAPPQIPTNTCGSDPYFTGGTSTQFNAFMTQQSGTTIYLAQKAVVKVDNQIYLPAGKTITTWPGNLTPNKYALMARFARNTSGGGAVIGFDSTNATVLKGVWVDGRHRAVEGGGFSFSASNVNISLLNATNYQILTNRVSDSIGLTAIQLNATNVANANGTVSGNLVTGYATTHFDAHGGGWGDGIDISSSPVTLSNNQIVDVTDVGIVLFSNNAPGGSQNSVVQNNTIVNSGNSAYAAIGVDPQFAAGDYAFTNAVVSNNSIVVICEKAG